MASDCFHTCREITELLVLLLVASNISFWQLAEQGFDFSRRQHHLIQIFMSSRNSEAGPALVTSK